MCRVICLSGPVAAGKSSVLESLARVLSKSNSVYVIREYIDVLPDANDKLRAYLSGQLSAYDFQNYILDYYEVNSRVLEPYDYILCERCPTEGVEFFAKLDLDRQRMTKDEYKQLVDRAKSLTFYPSPARQAKIKRIYTDNFSIQELTAEILLTINDYHIVQLLANPETIKNRIISRGRQAEIEAYSDEYISYMVSTYFPLRTPLTYCSA